MHTSTIRPTEEVRTFGTDEVIVTKTDLQGRIIYANDVFLRVSGYEELEVLGRPHNIVRHPDMPRAVFGLLWSEIQAGREVFAYVKNLARDGAGYWVLAHVRPTWSRGQIMSYHSNQRAPSLAGVDAIEPVYAALLAVERRHGHPKEAIEASTALLTQMLGDMGKSYDEFVWSLVGRPE